MDTVVIASTSHSRREEQLRALGISSAKHDYVVALAGNPNTGKSTVFNALTGLRQHTGNWPGKTITRAEGSFRSGGKRFKLVDLPGAYSLEANSQDEEVASDFICHGHPDVTVVVLDATALQRNLILTLQILHASPRVVVALNLMDQAKAHGLQIDSRQLARELGVPVVPMAARRGEGIQELVGVIADAALGKVDARSRHYRPGELPDRSESGLAETYELARSICARAVTRQGDPQKRTWQQWLDRLLTGRYTAFPFMALSLAVVLWLTIAGANVPSAMLAGVLIDTIHPALKSGAAVIGMPWWLDGVLIDGAYLSTAWVISVMLPPMAIFFPLFTLLEDFGYLPRVAFNLDRVFHRCGGHGKQCLSMAMGFGCNAAGVIATRVIDSPREKLIAILTNNFALCNGRWPTQIIIATIFVGALVAPAYSALAATLAVFAVACFGVLLTFGSSWFLSRTVLKGEGSSFSLELPPYRPPAILQTIHRSIIDRTLFVLWRAVLFALPAGIVIWTISNVSIEGQSLAEWAIYGLEPLGWLMGLSGVVLLAYVVAIPANEIVIPTILMLTVLTTGITVDAAAGAGVMFETDETGTLFAILNAGGWTLLTAICLMIFSLCHNPCSTTLYTIYKETGSMKWTVWSALLPTAVGFTLCVAVAGVWRLVAAL